MPSQLRAAFLFGGFFCLIWAHLWTIHKGFAKSARHGLLCILFPPYAPIFAVTHRHSMRPILIFYLLGLLGVSVGSLPF